MTATVDFSTVTNSIAALTITGVTIKDVDEIPESLVMSPSVLFPDTNGFITGIRVERDEMTGQWNHLYYTLHYRYIYCSASGGLGGLFASYSGLITKLAAVLLAFASDATLTGAIDNEAPEVSELGIVEDPAGDRYFGFVISLNIKQLLEV